jgi:hypothetical protein
VNRTSIIHNLSIMGFALFNIWLSLFLVYCCSVGTVAIKKIFKLEGTSAHPKDHSCEVSLLRIKKSPEKKIDHHTLLYHLSGQHLYQVPMTSPTNVNCPSRNPPHNRHQNYKNKNQMLVFLF